MTPPGALTHDDPRCPESPGWDQIRKVGVTSLQAGATGDIFNGGIFDLAGRTAAGDLGRRALYASRSAHAISSTTSSGSWSPAPFRGDRQSRNRDSARRPASAGVFCHGLPQMATSPIVNCVPRSTPTTPRHSKTESSLALLRPPAFTIAPGRPQPAASHRLYREMRRSFAEHWVL
jgi:hypothetical protein